MCRTKQVVIPVIIVQTHFLGFAGVGERVIDAPGLRRGIDIALLPSAEGVIELIIPHRHQLLVTDSFQGDLFTAEQFAMGMGKRNFHLKTAFFSGISFQEKSGFFGQNIPVADYDNLLNLVLSEIPRFRRRRA